MMKMYKRICIQRMKCRRRLILCCVATEEMPEALDNCMAGYLCPMPTASSNYIIFANGPYLMHLALFCWQSLSEASGIISLQLNIPNIISLCNFIAVGHYKCPCSIHPDYESGRTSFCQIIFEF